MTRKLGGGIGSAVNKNVGVRTGAPRHAVNERGVSQIGQQLGNKATDKARTLSGAAESVITSKVGLSVPLGNEVALNVGKGGTANRAPINNMARGLDHLAHLAVASSTTNNANP